MKTKAEKYEELSRSGDESVLTQAACDSIAITINGKPFHSDEPVSGDALADLLNTSLKQVGDTARFEYDDRSVLEVKIVKPGKAYIAAYSPFGPLN